MSFSELADQAAHSAVGSVAGLLASVALPLLLGHFLGPLAAEVGKVASIFAGFGVQLYRETGQHGWKAVLSGKRGLLDMIVGTAAGFAGAAAGLHAPV